MTNQLHTKTTLEHWDTFKAQVDDGALVVVNHSGGKDSQATYAVIRSLVPADQLIVVHADLGDDVEHIGLIDHIKSNINHDLLIAQAIWKDGSRKTLLNAIEDRGRWPSSAARYCTSDLKRTPCNKVVRAQHDWKAKPRSVINCFGFRAEESSARSKRPTWARIDRECTQTREWFEFSPIHDLTTAEVFEVIRLDGQTPHPIYATGNERLSCVFCVLGSANDIKNGAKQRPELFQRYVELEQKMNHKFRAKQSLAEIVNS